MYLTNVYEIVRGRYYKDYVSDKEFKKVLKYSSWQIFSQYPKLLYLIFLFIIIYLLSMIQNQESKSKNITSNILNDEIKMQAEEIQLLIIGVVRLFDNDLSFLSKIRKIFKFDIDFSNSSESSKSKLILDFIKQKTKLIVDLMKEDVLRFSVFSFLLVIIPFGRLLLPLLFPDLGFALKDLSLSLRKNCITKLDNKNPFLQKYSHQEMQAYCNSMSLATSQFFYYFFRDLLPAMVCLSITLTMLFIFKMWYATIFFIILMIFPIIEVKMKENVRKEDVKAASGYNQLLSFQDRLMRVINWLLLSNKVDEIENSLFADNESIYMQKIEDKSYSDVYKSHIVKLTNMKPTRISEEAIEAFFKIIPTYLLIFSSTGIIFGFTLFKVNLLNLISLLIMFIIILSDMPSEFIKSYYKCSAFLSEINIAKKAIESTPNINKNLTGVQIIDIESIEFSNVTKSYTNNEEDEIFKPISFKIEKGKPIIFRAPSGTGKTTIFAMIKGLLLPTRGKIILNVTDIYGEKKTLQINEINLPSLWNLLLEFSADMDNFNLSIRDLLKMAKPDISQEEQDILIKTAKLDKLVQDSGYDHLMSKCSAGQKDRLKLSIMLNKESILNILRNKDVKNEEVFSFVKKITQRNFELTEDIKQAYPMLSEKLVSLKKTYGENYKGYLFILFDLKGKLVCLDEVFGHIDNETAVAILDNLKNIINLSICFFADHTGVVKKNITESTQIQLIPLKAV